MLNQIAALHGTGVVPGFSPLDLPNLKAWYDASDTSSISVTSTKVTQWNDKSGNAYHLTQGTDAYRPNSGTRTVNSLNAIDYNTNTDTLAASTASNWKFMNDATGATTFVVMKLDTTPSADPYYTLTTRGGSLGAGPGFLNSTTTANKYFHAINANGSNIVLNTSTSTVGTSTVCMTTLSDPNNGTAANKSDIRKNAGSAEKNNVTTGAVQDANPAQALRVGDYEIGGLFSPDGLVCEIVICSGLLGASDITETQDYLIAKWGI
jgi:hypothetical protein